MKSERRHELQTNELADWLGTHIEKVRPYSRAILGVCILGLALAAIGLIWKNRAENRRLNAWTQYLSATNPENLELVADQNSNTPAGLYALLVSADALTEQGMENLFDNREEGIESLESARDSYGNLLAMLSRSQQEDPYLAGKVNLQLGKVKEALEDFESAIEHYRLVAEKWPEHAVGQDAQAMLDLIERRGAEEFYTEFYAALPPAAQPPIDMDSLTPGVTPSDEPFELEEFGSEGFDLDAPFEEPLPGAELDPDAGFPEGILDEEPGVEVDDATTAPAEPADEASDEESLPLDAPASSDDPPASSP